MGWLKDWARKFQEDKRDRSNVTCKAGTHSADILKLLCEGYHLTGWIVCCKFNTSDGGRDLRRVRRKLRAMGIQFRTYTEKNSKGREYKVTSLLPSQVPAARKLLKGE